MQFRLRFKLQKTFSEYLEFLFFCIRRFYLLSMKNITPYKVHHKIYCNLLYILSVLFSFYNSKILYLGM